MSNPFNKLPTDQRDALKADIEKRGIIYPIVVDKLGRVIDGHQRESIAQELSLPLDRITLDVGREEADALAISLNVFRRHLTKPARNEAIRKLREMGMTVEEVAKVTGASKTTVSKNSKGVSQTGNITDKRGRSGKSKGGRPRKTESAPKPATPTPPPASSDTDPDDDAPIPGVSDDVVRYEVTALIDSISGKPLNDAEKDRLTTILTL